MRIKNIEGKIAKIHDPLVVVGHAYIELKIVLFYHRGKRCSKCVIDEYVIKRDT